MISFLKIKWLCSSLRFYLLNAISNYSFWLLCTKEYRSIEYYIQESIRDEPKKIIKKRFIGYKFRNKIFSDNPGLIITDRLVWKEWKKKGLIK